MLQIDDLVFNAWGRRFFDRATVTLPAQAKVGLVGRNGVGKSTLFKLILGELSPDGGEIGMPRGARIASVDQEHPATDVTVLETILEADTERHALLQQLDTAEPELIGDIYIRLGEIDADRAPARAGEILAGLGFSTEDQARAMREFSGGWRMRVAMAAALFTEPDLLLLDEPTNYLDLEGAMWLEARLQKLKAWALGAGWSMVGGHPSLLKASRKPGGAGGDAVVRLVLKATVAHVEAKKPAGKWEKLAGAAYADIQPGEDGTPGSLLLDSIPGFRTLMQENRDRKVFAAFG